MRALYLALLLAVSACTSSVEAEPLPVIQVDQTVFSVRAGPWPIECNELIPYYEVAKNPSREAALTEQESSCNQFAQSPYAKGDRQFTDSTGKWLAQTHCAHLGSYQPFNRDWQMKCGIIYSELKEKNNNYPAQGGDSKYCVNRKIAEAEYNGGNWIIWELQLSSGNLVQAQVVCGTIPLKNGRKRAMWACKENYSYFKHISRRQPKYEELGGEICQ